jgi:hypothetical protein
VGDVLGRSVAPAGAWRGVGRLVSHGSRRGLFAIAPAGAGGQRCQPRINTTLRRIVEYEYRPGAPGLSTSTEATILLVLVLSPQDDNRNRRPANRSSVSFATPKAGHCLRTRGWRRAVPVSIECFWELPRRLLPADELLAVVPLDLRNPVLRLSRLPRHGGDGQGEGDFEPARPVPGREGCDIGDVDPAGEGLGILDAGDAFGVEPAIDDSAGDLGLTRSVDRCNENSHGKVSHTAQWQPCGWR